MVIDPLLTTLNDSGVYAQAYADDVACLVTGSSLMNICRKVQKTLDRIDTWCCANGLSANPAKTGIVLFTRRRKLDGLVLPKLKGVTIQLSKEIKYLGVILDSKLLWKSHVETKASKALTAFWQCKGVFGKTWGLSPSKVLWIYTAMIRPIITYASVVWMSRLSLVGVRRTLSRLQRTVAICCTGAFPTTSGPALDALIGLPPLDAFIRGEALKAICRLKHSGNWYGPCPALEHREGMDIDPTILSMPLDSMPSRVVLEKRYSVVLPEAQLWGDSENEPGKHCFRIFTDGSRTEHGSGSGVYVESGRTKLHLAFGMHASVFQAEVYAVQEAMNFVVEKRWRGRSICVCSDSQAALMALDSPPTTSGVVKSCKSRLNYVGRHNSLMLTWVPGHVGIAGNETSDSLAKMGSEANFFGPEPALPLPSAAITATVSKWVTTTHKRAWQAERGCRWTKLMLPVMSDRLSQTLLSLSRGECRRLVGLMTGHFLWAKHMERLGISDSVLCPACEEEDETADHFLCVCPAFARIRFEVFGTDVLRSDHLGSLAPQDLLRFLRRSGRFKEN